MFWCQAILHTHHAKTCGHRQHGAIWTGLHSRTRHKTTTMNIHNQILRNRFFWNANKSIQFSNLTTSNCDTSFLCLECRTNFINSSDLFPVHFLHILVESHFTGHSFHSLNAFFHLATSGCTVNNATTFCQFLLEESALSSITFKGILRLHIEMEYMT